jgi:ferredoxin
MPWINKDKCIGCGICVQECPVGAISMKEERALIDMEKCIRCGKCHDVCPQEAVRHDSERIPLEIKEKIEGIERNLDNFKTKKEKEDFLERMIKYYNKEKEIAEGTIEKINKKLK